MLSNRSQPGVARARAVRAREVSVAEIAESTLSAIGRVDRTLRAFTEIDPDAVRAEAGRIDGELRLDPDRCPLAGVTVGVKDIIDAKGLPTSFGSPAFEPFTPIDDSSCVAELRQAGALIVGKTRTSEFALAPDTVPTANPADHRLIPCGSSGGSAAAVGAELVDIGIGTDSGGSIRAPAALCGVVGLKPTYGLVSPAGVLPVCPALDTVGTLSRTVADARAFLAHSVDAGAEARCGSANRISRLREGLVQPGQVSLRKLRLGAIDHPVLEIVDARAQRSYDTALDQLRAEGATLVNVELSSIQYALGTALALMLGDASVLTETMRDRAHLIEGQDMVSAIQVAHLIPGVLVTRASRVRTVICSETARAFRNHRLDALILPGSVAPAIEQGNPDRTFVRADGVQEPVLWWGYPRPFYLANMTGQPSIVLPIDLQAPPLGIQLVGRPYGDHQLLDIAEAMETRVVNSS
jgi:aspartyl-tRNA(Asn)/glutamyl-tRNA(Gln) amidotransferase subunit A